ncbi:hypothetical protein HSBAA_14420 [Vreelandella sulfidaeris]|uniref:CBS domain-containing protein n=1 Tax=Vreelandella sulfidaeris TaxID=115553 RepID=A0A455U2D0_9GAMM|nr:hypothetical protein HSBAA_14420 [Halomonas sulfidaeris]
MQAIDIMTPKVVSVGPDAEVRDIAQLLLKHRISAVPVVDGEQRVIGIVSEGDLMRRVKMTVTMVTHGGYRCLLVVKMQATMSRRMVVKPMK